MVEIIDGKLLWVYLKEDEIPVNILINIKRSVFIEDNPLMFEIQMN